MFTSDGFGDQRSLNEETKTLLESCALNAVNPTLAMAERAAEQRANEEAQYKQLERDTPDRLSPVWLKFYNMVIDIPSFRAITTTGCNIIGNMTHGPGAARVGFMGRFGGGKSLISGLLLGKEIASHASIHTRGINFLFAKVHGRDTVAIDMAGNGSPMRDLTEEAMVDKIMESKFTRHIMFVMSNVFVYVVGSISYEDQLEIRAISQNLHEHKRSDDKRLFVVHNHPTMYSVHEYAAYKCELGRMYAGRAQWRTIETTSGLHADILEGIAANDGLFMQCQTHVILGNINGELKSHNEAILEYFRMCISCTPITERGLNLLQIVRRTFACVLYESTGRAYDMRVRLSKTKITAPLEKQDADDGAEAAPAAASPETNANAGPAEPQVDTDEHVREDEIMEMSDEEEEGEDGFTPTERALLSEQDRKTIGTVFRGKIATNDYFESPPPVNPGYNKKENKHNNPDSESGGDDQGAGNGSGGTGAAAVNQRSALQNFGLVPRLDEPGLQVYDVVDGPRKVIADVTGCSVENVSYSFEGDGDAALEGSGDGSSSSSSLFATFPGCKVLRINATRTIHSGQETGKIVPIAGVVPKRECIYRVPVSSDFQPEVDEDSIVFENGELRFSFKRTAGPPGHNAS